MCQSTLLAAQHQAISGLLTTVFQYFRRGGFVCLGQIVFLKRRRVGLRPSCDFARISFARTAERIDVSSVGADCQQAVVDCQSTNVSVDFLLPYLLAIAAVERDDFVHPSRDHKVIRCDQDVIKVTWILPLNADLHVLLHFAFCFGGFLGLLSQITSLQEPLLFFLAGFGMFVSVDAKYFFAIHQVRQVFGDDHLPTVDPRFTDTA